MIAIIPMLGVTTLPVVYNIMHVDLERKKHRYDDIVLAHITHLLITCVGIHMRYMIMTTPIMT